VCRYRFYLPVQVSADNKFSTKRESMIEVDAKKGMMRAPGFCPAHFRKHRDCPESKAILQQLANKRFYARAALPPRAQRPDTCAAVDARIREATAAAPVINFKKQEVCMRFLSGKCTRGAECRFYHHVEA
jgi:hypothetical protein